MPRLSKIGAAALAAFGWTSGSAVTADFLVVAGGGGSGGISGGQTSGGGGAGGFRTSAGTSGGGGSAEGKLSLNPLLSYTVTVGAGGIGGSTDISGTQGNDSVFSTITSTGGGYGGKNTAQGGTGGSGGGSGYIYTSAGGSGTANQGYAGGAGKNSGGDETGGGGGGAGATGANGSSAGGNGGNGVASSITGSSVTYAGGGGGGAYQTRTAGTGGSGGGGAGANNSNNPTAGTANLGGGGGGVGGGGASVVGANGGSGVVIISYPSPQKFGGGVVTSSGGNTIHTFTTSGTLSPLSSLTASALIVAGGGGGSGLGGGGAGGLQSITGQTIDTNSVYVVTVGAGGAGSPAGSANNRGTSGANSSFSIYATASVGGGGGAGYQTDSTKNGLSGGSGGGGGGNGGSGTGGAGTAGQGNAGGNGGTSGGSAGGGGGGAGAVGQTAPNTTTGGNGGAGLASSISGTSTFYAGGGGASGVTSATGGVGGGGNAGSYAGSAAGNGTANTGGGGGACYGSVPGGGTGGSGVVIISYAGSTQQMAGGTVTVAGGNVIHTFTSSGYLTPIVLVNNSLRFRNSASAYLSRTPSVSGDTQKFTYSAWVKLGQLSMSGGNYLFSAVSSSVTDAIRFTSGNNLQFFLGGAGTAQLVSTAVYRDPSAWYHVVVAVDTTQATAANRVRMYVNGVEITSFSTANYPSQNTNCAAFNVASKLHTIGNDAQLANYGDEYLTEINFVNAQQLTPNSFGSFNGLGVWQPIRYGGSYGTNGFYLPFTNTTSTTTLGYDFSPNGNNWTTNNISLTAGSTYDSMTDVPTLTSATTANYCVMNPINSYSSITVNNGNLQLTLTEAAYRKAIATMAFPTTGTYYLEATVSGGIDYVSYGIVTPNAPLNDAVGKTATGYGATTGTINWDRENNGSTSGNFWTISTTNPTLQIAYDATNGKLWLGYNNTWLDSSGGVTGNPSAGTNQTFTVDTTRTYLPSFGGYKSNSIVINLNFGQRPFAYTPPTGFVRLNTFNLPTPTIGATASTTANKYFDALLYTGNGSASQRTDISWANMQPDMVWIKNRTSANNHVLHDDVRGTAAALQPNLTNATDSPVGFGADGFGFDGVANQLRIFTSDGRYNTNGNAYVTWGWKGSGAAGVTNTAGSITSTVSANTSAGFSIVTYTGTGSTATVGHGLGVAPSMVITKCRNTSSTGWPIYHVSLGISSVIALQSTGAAGSVANYWGAANPTSTVFGLGSGGNDNNINGGTSVAYCFAQVAGYSAFGSYTGNGSSDGPFVFCGFRPRFVIIKSSTFAGADWVMYDSARNTYNALTSELVPNSSASENNFSGSARMDFVSNGIKIRTSGAGLNNSGSTYIYMIFAENPFKYANAR